MMALALPAAALAALGPCEARVATPELLDRLRPEFPDLLPEALGRALTAAGWRPVQWLTGGRRARGYEPPGAAPVEQNGPATAENLAARTRDTLAGYASTTTAPAASTARKSAFPAMVPAGAVVVETVLSAALPAEVHAPVPAPVAAAWRPGTVGPDPHAGYRPPVEPCRCGSRRWWRSRFRSQGWRCGCGGRPMPGDPVMVVEMQHD